MGYQTNKIPPLAWIGLSASIFVLSIFGGVALIRNAEVSVEAPNFKLDTTARLSKVLELSKELEAQAVLLQEKEAAYQRLEAEYKKLNQYNQPLKLLEPAIEEVNRVQQKTNLADIERRSSETAREAAKEIKEIAGFKEEKEEENDVTKN